MLGFGIVMAIAAGAGVLVSMAIRGLGEWANTPPENVERIAQHSPAAPPPPAISPGEPQGVERQDVEAAAREPAPAREVTRARSTAPRAAGPSKPPKPLLPELGAPRREWERRQQEYRLAKDVYDASERAEGFRWAQQYKVRARRYCRPLEQQRTAAFMEGCLNYAAGKTAADPG